MQRKPPFFRTMILSLVAQLFALTLLVSSSPSLALASEGATALAPYGLPVTPREDSPTAVPTLPPFPSPTPLSQGYAAQTPDPNPSLSPEAAINAAIARQLADGRYDYAYALQSIVVGTEWAYADVFLTSRSSGALLPTQGAIIIAAKDASGYWSARLPEDHALFNEWLEQIPGSLVSDLVKSMSRWTPEFGIQALADVTGHYLPWPASVSAYVSQNPSVHGAGRIDFMIDQLDISATKGGTIVYANDSHRDWVHGGSAYAYYNNAVVIQHSPTEYTLYLHLKYGSIPTWIKAGCPGGEAGQVCALPVSRGVKIGEMGTTGWSSGPHLHLSTTSSWGVVWGPDFVDEDGDSNTTENVYTAGTGPHITADFVEYPYYVAGCETNYNCLQYWPFGPKVYSQNTVQTVATPTPSLTARTGIGIYSRATGAWYLRTSAAPGASDYQATYGGSWASPIVGDWNGDGTVNIGVYDAASGNWYLRNTNNGGAPDTVVSGYGGWWGLPLSGDWDGNGTDTIGLFVPSTGEWLLRNSNSYGSPDIYFTYGGSWGYPVVGDWNGDGRDTIGIYNPTDGNWYLRNSNAGGGPDIIVGGYGGWWGFPIIGDWDGNGTDTIGLFAYQTGQWLLRNSNSYGSPSIEFVYGGDWGTPLAGDWNGPSAMSADFMTFDQNWDAVNQTLSAIPTDYSLVDLMRFALDPSTPLGTTPSEAPTAPAAPTMMPLPPVEPQPVKPPPPSQPQG
ncbi:MAG: VCBS repeat domain-containing M23 family metallopeptidase [Anaerolineae bacterium]|nr:VCBS repeat domain-containing M23 family metallopeptidase [Anaerolineae bacterium]